jgi:hypothetical protein
LPGQWVVSDAKGRLVQQVETKFLQLHQPAALGDLPDCAATINRAENWAVADPGGRGPGIDCHFDPGRGYRHRQHPAMLANQVHDAPPAILSKLKSGPWMKSVLTSTPVCCSNSG